MPRGLKAAKKDYNSLLRFHVRFDLCLINVKGGVAGCICDMKCKQSVSYNFIVQKNGLTKSLLVGTTLESMSL